VGPAVGVVHPVLLQVSSGFGWPGAAPPAEPPEAIEPSTSALRGRSGARRPSQLTRLPVWLMSVVEGCSALRMSLRGHVGNTRGPFVVLRSCRLVRVGDPEAIRVLRPNTKGFGSQAMVAATADRSRKAHERDAPTRLNGCPAARQAALCDPVRGKPRRLHLHRRL
jgi:hypothetical protein